jgi:hypothetical protein
MNLVIGRCVASTMQRSPGICYACVALVDFDTLRLVLEADAHGSNLYAGSAERYVCEESRVLMFCVKMSTATSVFTKPSGCIAGLGDRRFAAMEDDGVQR